LPHATSAHPKYLQFLLLTGLQQRIWAAADSVLSDSLPSLGNKVLNVSALFPHVRIYVNRKSVAKAFWICGINFLMKLIAGINID
jgi:hypothetical protein